MCKMKRGKSHLLDENNIVYKYKPVNEQSVINGLLTDSLYMSTLDKMNDPLESGFYVNGDYDSDKIRDFQQWWLEEFYCISFSMSDNCRRLWNYYTDGMKGMVLGYKISSIREAFKKIGLWPYCPFDMMPPIIKPDDEHYLSEGKVIYDGEKTNLTKYYQGFVGIGKESENISNKLFFHKDKSWKEEKEYRFIVDCDFMDNNVLENIIPETICVGYRINQIYLDIIKKYCKEKGVSLFQCQPDFGSCNSRKLIKTPVTI